METCVRNCFHLWGVRTGSPALAPLAGNRRSGIIPARKWIEFPKSYLAACDSKELLDAGEDCDSLCLANAGRGIWKIRYGEARQKGRTMEPYFWKKPRGPIANFKQGSWRLATQMHISHLSLSTVHLLTLWYKGMGYFKSSKLNPRALARRLWSETPLLTCVASNQSKIRVQPNGTEHARVNLGMATEAC